MKHDILGCNVVTCVMCVGLAGAGAVHAVPGYHAPAAAAAVDPAVRVPAAADRLNMPTDPLLRLQLASAGLGTGPGPVCAGDGTAAVGVSAGEMSHTHTHSHTHLHLHQPDSTSAAASSLFPPLHPVLTSQLLQSSALNLPGIQSRCGFWFVWLSAFWRS